MTVSVICMIIIVISMLTTKVVSTSVISVRAIISVIAGIVTMSLFRSYYCTI